MDTEQELTVRSPVQSQSPIRAWRSSRKAAVSAIEKTPEYLASRFQGDGVRYKAKLIGIDEVPGPQGDKMCLDSMMKLKGWEVAGRHHGQHKQRVWLKVSTAGVRIIDERTGAVEYEHVLEKVSSLKKDNSDPRAFSYIYGQEGTFKLFFIKMANLADPVIEDIRDVFQVVSRVEPVPETLITQNGTSMLLDEHVTTPQKGQHDIDLFAPVPNSPTQNSNQGQHDIDLFAPVPNSPTQNSNQNGTSMLLDEHVTTPQKGQHDIDLFAPVPNSPTQNSNQGQHDIDLFAPVPNSPTQNSNQTLSHGELMGTFSASSETQAPTSPTTPSFNFSQPGSPLQSSWASPQTPPALPVGMTSFTLSTAAAWGPQGQLRAPYPSSNGPWEATGLWTPQQIMSGWGQASLVPQGVPGPQSPGVMPLPGASWGITQPGYPTTAATFCPTGEEFPQLGTPAQPPKPAPRQGPPAKVSFQVSNPFTSDA